MLCCTWSSFSKALRNPSKVFLLPPQPKFNTHLQENRQLNQTNESKKKLILIDNNKSRLVVKTQVFKTQTERPRF